MASSFVLGNTSEETFNILCSACKEQDKNREAEKYCVDCQEYYCSECLKLHSTLPALKRHKLLDKEDGHSGQLLMVPTERCERHNFKTVDMFCQNHDMIGCGTCMAVDHRACPDVFYIPEFVATNTAVPSNFLQRLNGVESKLKGFLNTFENERKNLQTNKSTEIETIKTVTKILEQRIKESERTAISDIEKKYNELKDDANEYIDTLKHQLENVEKTKYVVTSTNQNQSQAFVNVKLNQSIALAAEKSCTEVEKIKLGGRVKFVLDHATEVMMARHLCIGKVQIMPRLYSFVPKGTIDIRLSSDSKQCNIYGSCVLPDGSVVFSDAANKTLKLLDCCKLTVTNDCNLSSEPYEVCCVEENKIAVCLTNEKKIQIFVCDTSFIPLRSIDVNFSCRGICYRDDTFYVSDETCVYMCDNDGTTMKKCVDFLKGEKLFSHRNIHSICSSINGLTLYICANGEEKCVATLGRDSSVLNISKAELKYADGLAIAEYGKVFVCEPRYVAQLSGNGSFEFAVIHDTPLAQALCFNCRTGRLYLPAYEKNIIKIFEFNVAQ
ncbi:uncharacterized protein LOC123532378 [Mercenaria mercenaria]|uniref:uncharacterized protein LOC123532378 n=1 Tax=Mercenaria mercenaria TaxID=6596 RepID=UPI00234F9676|nr:uncharacterized protein LOC123532378 [Mercenaria mercenaria]